MSDVPRKHEVARKIRKGQYLKERESMNRIFELQRSLLREIDKQDKIEIKRDQPLDWERIHLASLCQTGVFDGRGKRRGSCISGLCLLNPTITDEFDRKTRRACGGGYLPGGDFWKRQDFLMTRRLSCWHGRSGITAKKSEIGTPVEEIVKDADVIDSISTAWDLPEKSRKYAMKICCVKMLAFRLSPLK